MTNIHFHNAGAAVGVGYSTCIPLLWKNTPVLTSSAERCRLCAWQFESGFRDARL